MAHTPSSSVALNPEGEERRKMGRRALIAAAGLGVVGAVVAEKDTILSGVGNLTQQEIQNAVTAGRRALAQELANLEGVAITGAVDVAEITHNAVNLFVMPIVNVLRQPDRDHAGCRRRSRGKSTGLHVTVAH